MFKFLRPSPKILIFLFSLAAVIGPNVEELTGFFKAVPLSEKPELLIYEMGYG